MGRLEDIIARNKNPKANRERMVVGIGFGVFILIILSLMVFTDLGKAKPLPEKPRVDKTHDHQVDDVPLRAPAPRAKSK